MRSLRLTATALALIFPVTVMAMGIQIIVDGQVIVLRDVPQSAWFATHVQQAAEAGIVSGYRDTQGRLNGLFRPTNPVTLAETLKIAVEGAGYDAGLYGSQVDAGVGLHWAAPYVAVAKSEHFTVSISRSRLDRPATRNEVAAIFTSAFHVSIPVPVTGTRYTDVEISTSNAASIEALSRDGVVSGDTDVRGQATGTFRPWDPINRAEVVKIVMNARAKYGTPGVGLAPVEAMQTTVRYTARDGFLPAVLRIAKGTTVTFTNDDVEPLWVASNPHPTHTGYPELNSNGSLSQGEIFVFTFNRLGTWGYHNHLNASWQGTVIVE